jgi:hypothetical protein
MALKGPNEIDCQKLHNEINQTINQKFTITTLAITIFGLIVAFMLEKFYSSPLENFKGVPYSVGNMDGALYGASILLLLVLSILFCYIVLLRRKVLCYAIYLDLTGASNWEHDWKNFKKLKKGISNTGYQAVIFLALGILAYSIPVLLSLISQTGFVPIRDFYISTVIFIFYFVLIFLLGIGLIKSKRNELETQWKKVGLVNTIKNFRDFLAIPIEEIKAQFKQNERQDVKIITPSLLTEAIISKLGEKGKEKKAESKLEGETYKHSAQNEENLICLSSDFAHMCQAIKPDGPFSFAFANEKAEQDSHYHENRFEIYYSESQIHADYRHVNEKEKKSICLEHGGAIIFGPNIIHKVNLSGLTMVLEIPSIKNDKYYYAI